MLCGVLEAALEWPLVPIVGEQEKWRAQNLAVQLQLATYLDGRCGVQSVEVDAGSCARVK